MKTSKGKVEADGTIKRDLGIDKRRGFTRRQKVTNAAAHDGARLREGLIDPSNTTSDVRADTAYPSKANGDFLSDRGKTSRIHCRKPVGKPMPKRIAKANARKSVVRATVEHVFAQQKDRMKLTIRSIGIKRAEATIITANIACISADGDGSRGEPRPLDGKPAKFPGTSARLQLHGSTIRAPNRAINVRPRSKTGNQPALGDAVIGLGSWQDGPGSLGKDDCHELLCRLECIAGNNDDLCRGSAR